MARKQTAVVLTVVTATSYASANLLAGLNQTWTTLDGYSISSHETFLEGIGGQSITYSPSNVPAECSISSDSVRLNADATYWVPTALKEIKQVVALSGTVTVFAYIPLIPVQEVRTIDIRFTETYYRSITTSTPPGSISFAETHTTTPTGKEIPMFSQIGGNFQDVNFLNTPSRVKFKVVVPAGNVGDDLRVEWLVPMGFVGAEKFARSTNQNNEGAAYARSENSLVFTSATISNSTWNPFKSLDFEGGSGPLVYSPGRPRPVFAVAKDAGGAVLEEFSTMLQDGFTSLEFDDHLNYDGPATVTIESPGALRKIVNISYSNGVPDTANGTFSLHLGDVDGDNEVGLLDYFYLSDHFNTSSLDETFWQEDSAGVKGSDCDWNLDRSVDLLDYFLLSDSYGMVGD